MGSKALYTPSPGSSLPAKQLIPGTAEVQIANPIIPTKPLFVAIPPSSILEGKAWSAKITGILANVGAAATATFRVFVGNSTTIANNTAIGTTGAVAQAASTAPFIISIDDAIYDSVSGKLTGAISAIVNNTLVAKAAFSAVVTGISNTNDPVLTLSLAATLSVANAGSYVQINQMEIDW